MSIELLHFQHQHYGMESTGLLARVTGDSGSGVNLFSSTYELRVPLIRM
jgi:hypothetical protein